MPTTLKRAFKINDHLLCVTFIFPSPSNRRSKKSEKIGHVRAILPLIRKRETVHSNGWVTKWTQHLFGWFVSLFTDDCCCCCYFRSGNSTLTTVYIFIAYVNFILDHFKFRTQSIGLNVLEIYFSQWNLHLIVETESGETLEIYCRHMCLESLLWVSIIRVYMLNITW